MMTTQTHALILSTPNFEIQSNIDVKQLLGRLIRSNNLTIDYFGGELDNQQDYLDDEMEAIKNASTIITIHFDLDSETEINYDSNKETVLNHLIEIINDGKVNIKDVVIDGNELEIYLY